MASSIVQVFSQYQSSISQLIKPLDILSVDELCSTENKLCVLGWIEPSDLPHPKDWSWTEQKRSEMDTLKVVEVTSPEQQIRVWIVHNDSVIAPDTEPQNISFIWCEKGTWNRISPFAFDHLVDPNQEHLKYLLSEDCAQKLDDQDELKDFRAMFHYPRSDPKDQNSKESIYLCGNSLGLQPKITRKLVNDFLDDWANYGVEGHFASAKPWVSIDEPLQANMAEVVGAKREEVAIMNSLTVNMHLMFIPFYRPTESRYKILMEAGAFPSDRYGVESHLRLHNIPLESGLITLRPREGEYYLRTEDILQTIEEQGDSIALVFFSGVQYYTGQLFDIKAITEAGHKKGCRVGFDLAHAVGNARIHLHDWNVDFAVWCCYKYLNSGPGNIAGCFVHGRLCGLENASSTKDLLRLGGWWSQSEKSRFDMTEEFDPIPGANGFRLSNPPVICVCALEGSLDIFHQAGMDRLRSKSLKLTRYLEFLLDTSCPKGLIEIITPRDPSQRGCQLSCLFKSAGIVNAIADRLLQEGVIADVRKPDVIRIAPAPLYNSFCDVWRFVSILRHVLENFS